MHDRNAASGLPVEVTRRVYDILVEHAGADEPGRESFVHSQTSAFVTEYRFCGALGFGGKFWRNHSRRPDGTSGEHWYVSTYRELETLAIRAAIEACNRDLDALQADYEKS